MIAAVAALGTVGASAADSIAADVQPKPAAADSATVASADSAAADSADSAASGRISLTDSAGVAAVAPRRGAPVDSARHESSPFGAMLRSAVLPGWGQVYNGKLPKAVVVLGGEGFLIYKAVEEWQKESDAAEAGDVEGANRHMNLKVNYIWWTAVVHLLQMADAYVDAQLAHFEADFEPEEAALPGERREPRLRLAFRAAF